MSEQPEDRAPDTGRENAGLYPDAPDARGAIALCRGVGMSDAETVGVLNTPLGRSCWPPPDGDTWRSADVWRIEAGRFGSGVQPT